MRSATVGGVRRADTKATGSAGTRQGGVEPLVCSNSGPPRCWSITPHDVRTIVQSMVSAGLAPRTVRTNYGVLRGTMSTAVEAELIAVNPCRGVKLPEVPKVAKPVALVSEVHRLAEAVPDEYRPAIFLGSLGLREAEVFGLRVKAIDFFRKTVTMEETVNEVDGRLVVGDGKTRSSVRTISLPDFIVRVLADHLQRTGRREPDDYVLQAPDGGPVRANNFRRRVYRPALKKAKLDSRLTFHRLRHSAGHHMRETGEPLEVIQKRLGHASIRTTADVCGSLPVAVDKAAPDRLNAMYESVDVRIVTRTFRGHRRRAVHGIEIAKPSDQEERGWRCCLSIRTTFSVFPAARCALDSASQCSQRAATKCWQPSPPSRRNRARRRSRCVRSSTKWQRSGRPTPWELSSRRCRG